MWQLKSLYAKVYIFMQNISKQSTWKMYFFILRTSIVPNFPEGSPTVSDQ